MELRNPVIITPRLQAGVAIRQGEEIAFVSIDYSKRNGDSGRTRYVYTIDMPDGQTYSGSDLQSGCQGGSLQEGLESLLAFLSGAGEAYSAAMRNRDLDDWDSSYFPLNVAEWAYQVSDEIDMLRLDLAEMDGTMDELAIRE